MRFVLLLAPVLVVAAAGCGGGGSAAPAPATPDERIERCIDRLAAASVDSGLDDEVVRAYARSAYCERFERRGWLHDDGAFRIAVARRPNAQKPFDGMCFERADDGSLRKFECPFPPDGVQRIECGLLRFVRRSEVEAYVRELRARAPVRCADGESLEGLGVP